MDKILLHRAGDWWALALIFEPRDLWVGMYWKTFYELGYQNLDLYVTVIPTLPVRISVVLK